ncbi:MAG: acyl-ACP thioesterase domain-containing protein [Solirubrobacteraceae bacterium]
MDTALVAPRPGGRTYTAEVVAGLADAAPGGRVRLDAIARWLQDVAYRDVGDAGLLDDGTWIVRRLRIRVETFPAFDERCQLTTFCSGVGAVLAERRTTIRGDAGAHVEAVALWVHLEPGGAGLRPPSDAYREVYGASAGDRRVRARLFHDPASPPGAPARPFAFRAADLDVADHVNNAAYWTAVEELLAGADDPAVPYDAEIEHRGPADAGPLTITGDAAAAWILDSAGTTLATIRELTA